MQAPKKWVVEFRYKCLLTKQGDINSIQMTVKIQYKSYSRKLKKRRENEESLNTTATQQKEKEAESKIIWGECIRSRVQNIDAAH